MRITLFTHGTRGDIWPTLSLAAELRGRDHDVTLAVQEELRPLAAGAGIPTAPLPFDFVTWLATEEGQRLLHIGGTTFMRRFKREYTRHADAFGEATLAAATGADALVTMHNVWDWSLPVADKLRIPIATVYPLPVAPSREYSSLVITKGRVPTKALRLASTRLTAGLWWRDSAPVVKAFRARLGLPAASASTFNRLQEGRPLGLHTVSNVLFPRPTDWAPHLKVTGAWRMPSALRAASGETLPEDLITWLDAGPPPVLLCFGSMPVLEPQRMLDDVLAVTGALGVRAIIDAQWAGELDLPSHVYAVSAVDHDELMPRCVAAVHHGGAGSVTASIRAGCPTLVCSVFGDQVWWGHRVVRLGAGAHVPFRKLDRTSLHRALATLLRPDVRDRARELGAAMREEGDGLPEAVQLLDDWLVTAEPPAALAA